VGGIRLAWAGAVTLAVAFGAPDVRADAEADAHVVFAKARALRLGGDCAGALPLFRQTYALYPQGLGSLRNIAECEESVGHFVAARQAWLALGRELVARTDARYAGWADDARLAADRLGSMVATLVVDVKGTVSDRVTVNGDVLPASLFGVALERDPGVVVVRLAGTGESRTVDLAAGDVKRVDVAAPAAATAAVPTGPAEHRANPAHRDDAAWTAGAWAAAGLGAAAFVGAAVSFVVRQNALDAVDAQCPQYRSSPCDASLRSTVDRGRVATTLADVFLAVGIAGAATSVTLFAIRGRREPQIAVVAAPGALSAVGRF
jgi:hypothetical protein